MLVARVVATGCLVVQVARAARRLAPLRPDVSESDEVPSISVVVPARDEERRLGPLLAALRGAPGVREVVVVDDGSHDRTAGLARSAGATVVTAGAPPEGWTGKCWALQRGTEAAGGEWIVTLDADVRPLADLPGAVVQRARTDGFDLVTVATRAECADPGGRWLHAALLASLVLRFGPAGVRGTRLANGQCMAFARRPLLDAGGLAPVRDQVVEDVALARHLASCGWRVALLDGCDIVAVEGYGSIAATWRGWGRSLGLPGVEPVWRRAAHLSVLALTTGALLPRLLARRADAVDLVVLALRAGLLVGTAGAFRPRGAAYWLSPLADGAAVACLGAGLVRPQRTWRGRRYS
jgi:dolichol-phosphate mannosyltransferase